MNLIQATLGGKEAGWSIPRRSQPSLTWQDHTRIRVDRIFTQSVRWLVVAGPKAMFKGAGTINGHRNYRFMLCAIDEQLTPSMDVDLFRIKIWDKENSDAPVYDNQVECSEGSDDSDPCTDIKGGSNVIHKRK